MNDESKQKYPEEFLRKVAELEKKDITLSSKDQVNRLTKNTSLYLNLNPYEVLCLPYGADKDLIRKHYKKLCIAVHPDKNRDDTERAKHAFEALKLAMKILETPEELGKIRLIYDEANAMFEAKLKAKRKKIVNIEEDEDPVKYFKTKRSTIAKLFADYELKRQELVESDAIDRKQRREEEIFTAFTTELENDFQKAWEEGREKRINSWKKFSQYGKKKNREFKPPAIKPQQR